MTLKVKEGKARDPHELNFLFNLKMYWVLRNVIKALLAKIAGKRLRRIY